MGISISLLFAEPSTSSYTDVPGNSASKWRQPTSDPNSNPNPSTNPSLVPRDRGPLFAEAYEFHASEILAIVSSALNCLVATAL